MRAKEFTKPGTITLDQIYDGHTPDRDEHIWNYVSHNDFNIPFTIHTIQPMVLRNILEIQYGVDDIEDLFHKIQPEQEEIIKQYTTHPNLHQEIIILNKDRVIDGNHRALAAVLAKKPIRYIDVSEDIEEVNEAPLPPDWDPEKMNLRQTFKNRLKYALDRAKRLGGGSSRVAMTIDYEGRPTALKVAKNLKGLAQNEAEIEILNDYYVGQLPIVIPLIDYDKANKRPVWLQTEIAKKVQAPTLMKMLHTPALWLLTNYVNMLLGKASSKLQKETPDTMKRLYFQLGKDPTEKDYEIFLEYASELASLVDSTSLETGDLQNPANWGIYNGRPVVIDLGFTGETKGLYGYKE